MRRLLAENADLIDRIILKEIKLSKRFQIEGPNLIFKPGIIQYKIVEIGEKDDKLIKMVEFGSDTNYLSNDELREKILKEFVM